MRYLAAAALVAAHLALLAVPGELLAPEAPALGSPVPAITTNPFPAAVAAAPAESLSLADLDRLALQEDSLIVAVQENAGNVDAMVELAYLYLRHGWSDRAIGPLARAVEVAPARDDLHYELLLAVKLSGRAREAVDLAAAAREFVETVALWGHGC